MKVKKAAFLVLALVFSSSILFAQNPLKKGVYKLGGSVEFTSGTYKNEDNEQTNLVFNISPSYSYFVTDNLLIGGTAGFIYNEVTFKSNGFYGYESKNISRSLGIGPEINYYFNSAKFVPFIGFGATYLKSLGRDNYNYRIYGQAGVNYFISSNAALEPFLSYSILKYSENSDSIKDLSIGIRVSYFITD